jgi:hypothetical protein
LRRQLHGWIEAADDDESMRRAKKVTDCFRLEVWDRGRLVGRHQERGR